MRYLSAAAIVVVFSTVTPAARGALNVSIANYQLVSEQRASITQWYLTFRADLVNSGAALTGITATVASRSSNVQVVAGQGTLHFGPIPANGRATSADSFTLLVDRSVAFDWSQVEWSFLNPVANAGPNQTAPVTGTVTLNGSASSNPTGVGTLSYNWAFQSVPSGSKAVLVRPDTVSPNFVVDAPGTYQCRLTVSNGSGSDTAIVSVSTINSPPVAAAGSNQTVAVGATVQLNGSKSSDVDGDALSYSWAFVSVPPKSTAILFNALTAAPTFVANAAGTYIVQLVVRDGKVDSQASTVTISTENTRPVANAGRNQTVIAGAFVQLDGAGSTDIDGDALTYRWSFNSVPSGSAAALGNGTSVNPTFTADIAGTYIAQLIVNDGKLDSVASTVTITTNAVQAPTANAGPDVTVHAGTTVQLSGSGIDPQNFPLTYTWSLPTRPANSTASLSATKIANPTFVADLPGTYAAQLVVNNGVLSSAPDTVTITTTNTPPVADPGPAQSVYAGDTVYLDGSRSSDADSDPISAYSWSILTKPNGSSAALVGPNTKTPSFIADVAGAYVVQLIVSDPFANSQAKTVTINVGTRTIEVTPSPLKVFAPSSPTTLNIALSPAPTSPVAVTLAADTPGIVSFSSNPATVPANSSGVNVNVTGISPGTVKVTVSAMGYYAATATINVVKPTISIALNGGATAVGLTHKAGGVITLDAPAPTGGTAITFSSSSAQDGAVTFEANPVTVPSGSKTAAFSITGAQLGGAMINASASGYNSGSQAVEVVMLGSVSLPSGVTVGSGQSTPLNVQLSAPAPADGVTLTLTSSDPGKFTISPASVSIKPGATAPDAPPQVNGTAGATGEATVNATAGGFYSDRQTIKVIASVTFKEQAVSVGPGGVKGFTILLSAPAPTGGLLVYLASSNESVATVLSSGALVPSGQQSVDSTVSGVAVGTADITLSTNPSLPGNQYFSGAGAVLRVTVARPSITISTESLPAGMAGGNYPSTQLSASGGTGTGYFWTIPVGSLPSGLSLSTSGVISGTLASSATTSTFTVQVQDSGSNKDTKTFTITVNPPLIVSPESLPPGTAGSSYETTLTASGGSGSGYLWSLISGALPAGLSLSSTGVISGSLSASATTSTFTVQVQDSATNTISKQFTLTVNQQLRITTGTLPTGMAGSSYPSTTLAATGGTGSGYSWSVTGGALPADLTLSAAGAISGTLASSATTASFTVQVKDSLGNTATRLFTLSIVSALTINTASLPAGVAGATYNSTTLEASGGSGTGYSWGVSAGSLPSGLTLSAAGLLSGAVSSSATTCTFTIQVQCSGGFTATKQFTITINSGLTITTTSLPAGSVGASYPTTTLSASGGTGSGYTWSLASGSLPSGLILSTAGVISGAPNASATTSTFMVQVKDSGNNTATQQFTLTVNPALSITTTSLPTGMAGASYASTTLAASGGSGAGYSWSLTAGSLPSGLTLTTAGVLSGTLASNATSSTFTIQLKDSAGGTAAKEFTVTVYPALSITTASLPAGVAGANYPSQLFAATGGSGAGYGWSVSSGSLPSSLTLTSSGVLSGTLSGSATTSTFTVQVKDGANNIVSKQFTLTVNPALSISTGSLPVGVVGALYPTTTLAATGGTGSGYTWSVSIGSLPSGLSLSAAGVLSGTLSSSATASTFTIQVQDSAVNVATKQFTITVETSLTVATTSLPNTAVGAIYPATTLAAAGGSGTGFTWSISSGSLPAGLTLSSAGVLSGTLSSSAATSTFTVQVQDSANHTATRQFTIAVNPALSITTGALPAGTAGSAYPATTLAATGGSGTGYVWSVTAGSLPSGLNLSGGGVLSGTLSASAANATFTVQVQDSDGTKATKPFTITVHAALSIATASLPNGMAGATYTSTTLVASGGAGGYSWSVQGGALPDGLTLSAAGVLSGTLSASAATSTFTVQVQDSDSNKATKDFTVVVLPALKITTASLPSGIAGTAYSSTTLAASGGTGGGYSWSVSNGSLPPNLTLTTAGVLSGTLSASASTTNVTIRVQDSGGNSATQAFAINVNPALSVTTTALPDGIASTVYSATTLAANGGTGSGYTWSLSSGLLPSGLTLSTSGTISGTLSASAATSTFTIQVKDSGNNTATKQFTINVGSGLGITTALLPAGIAGTAYGPVNLAASGGTGTGYAWSVTSGALPSGLSVSSGGVISGTLASNAATSTFTVQVQDSGNNTASRQFTITVTPALSITTSSLPSGIPGTAYPATALAASGGTGTGYAWSVSAGALPSGLTLSSAGSISGTLDSSATTATFTVHVQDSGGNTATKPLTITVSAALGITTTTLPDGVAGAIYPSTTLVATGGAGAPYTWSITAGALPSSLILSTAGVISGTLSTSAVGSTFTIQVKDSGNNTATRQFTLTVNPALEITTASLPAGIAGAVYSATLAATGGTGSGYTWSVTTGALPAGLSLSAAGALSGTLSNSATSATFTVQVKDSGNNTATKLLTLTVNPALSVTTASVPNGMAGAAYPSTSLAASGGTATGYAWSITAGSLPTGLSLAAGGTISGTLSASATTSTFTVQVKDSGNNAATKEFTITVYPALTITTGSLPGGTGGALYSSTTLAASGGTGSGYVWSLSAGSLPTGLTLSSAGAISGTLSYYAVTSTFTVQVKDSGNYTATKPFTITVAPGLLTITTNATLPGATVGTLYTASIVAVGGTPPYTWSASGLPAWLTLGGSCGEGTLCGTPIANGVASFTITVTDSASPTHQSASQTFNLTVTGGSTVGAITVPDVSVGANLQVPITITLSPPTSAAVQLSITSGNAAAVLLGNASEGGKSPVNMALSASSISVQIYVKALASSGTVTITATADGYTAGSGTVTITKSGFVLSGPNGIGSDFTTYQGVTAGLIAYPYRLGSNDVAIENQPIRGGFSVNVPIAVSPSTMGTLSSPYVPFSGGDSSATALFTASSINTGNASITLSPPAGSLFSKPASGDTLNVNILTSGFIPPSGVAVGRNLQTPVSVSLNGPAGNDTVVTIQSLNSSLLKFASSPNGGSTATLSLTIKKGFSATPDFYVRGYGSSGSVDYTISASTYGTITASMPLGPSGFVITTPAGQGTDFNVTLGGPDPTLAISTALYDMSGNVVALQSVAADVSVSASVTSFTPGVGTVSPTSVQIAGGASSGYASFHAVSTGTTTIMASASGYNSASVKATVTNVQLFLNPVGSVGRFLAAPGLVNLNTPAVVDVPVTITSNSGLLKVAANATDAGGSSIIVTVKAGNTNAAFWVFGLGSSGSGSYTAAVSGSGSVSDTVTLAPSAVVLYMGAAPGNPSCFGTGGFACNINLASGSQTVYAVTYQLTTDGTDAINGSQPLAGNTPLSVLLGNSAPATGSVPGTINISGGSNFTSFTFTPSSTGSTVITANKPSGWTAPAYAAGFDLTQLGITVH